MSGQQIRVFPNDKYIQSRVIDCQYYADTSRNFINIKYFLMNAQDMHNCRNVVYIYLIFTLLKVKVKTVNQPSKAQLFANADNIKNDQILSAHHYHAFI